MGKLDSGILGTVKGKVGNVVGQTWKGINYVRVWVKPTDRKSAEQLIYRNRMKYLNEIGRVNNQLAIHVGYMRDVEGKPLSEYNAFFRDNMINDVQADVKLLQFSAGPVGSAEITQAFINSVSGALDLQWDTTTGQDKKPNDTVRLYFKPTGSNYLIYLTQARTLRSDGGYTNVNFRDEYGDDGVFFMHFLNGNQEASYTTSKEAVIYIP